MKNKMLGIFVITSLTVIFGSTFSFGENSLKTKNTNSILNKNSNIHSSSTATQTKERSSIINFEDIDGETLYKAFNGLNADEIIELLNTYNQDSDRIVVTSDGEILKGQIDMKNKNSNEIRIDTDTDPDSLTVKELKLSIENYKDEINELAENQSQ
jgi:hypothetical protein